ncbi:MAG: hypothetical protein QOH31_3248 [Verrucomicrobiota bacterium]|jgi:hypothetical protein
MLETRLRRPTLSSNSRTGTRRKLAKLADTEFEEGRAGVLLYKPPRVLGVSWQIPRALTSN